MIWPRLTRVVVLLCLGCLALVAGCRSEPKRSDSVVLWTAFEAEIQELRRLVEEFERTTQIRVQVLKVPFGQLQNKFLVAAPAGQGPDLLIGPQDWLGVFATADLLEPVPESLLDAPTREDLLPVALQGITYQGQAYALPLMIESLALIRNPSLLPRSPANTKELFEFARDVQTQEIKGFYYDLQDFYFSFPFFSAHGAYIFRETANGVVDPDQLGLAGPGAVAAAEYLTQFRQANLIPLGAKTDFAKSLYLDGKVAMTLNGPWFLGDIRAARTPYVIEPIPPAPDGHPASPLVGVTGVMLNKRAQNHDEAVRLMAYLGDPETVLRLTLSSGRPPARRSALARASADPGVGADIAAFAQVCETGVPMPSHPAASAVWEPMKQALDLITKGQAQAAPELKQTQERIRQKIRLMME